MMPLLPTKISLGYNRTVILNDDGGAAFTSSRDWMQSKLGKLQRHLELDQDITRFQPRQVPVVNADDGNARVVLLTTAKLLWKQQAIESGCFGGALAVSGAAPVSSNVLRGSDFRISERFRCLADHRGQVQGGVGFIFEGVDLVNGVRVAVKFFHKADDDAAASARISLELVTNVRLYHGLHTTCIDEDDEGDIRHLARLRDVLVDAPIFDDSGAGLSPSVFRASAMVFDWADGGDVHSYLRERGGITPAEGGRLFRQILRGLRCLHRRGIVHRDIKPENVLLARGHQEAYLCDFGFAKHVPSVQPADLRGDPTTCYQSPERWLACHSAPAALARSQAVKNGGVCRRDETPASLFASDIFSAGVSLFIFVAYRSILTRLLAEKASGDMGEIDGMGLPALNVFQHVAGGDMFGLLQAGPRVGGVQGRLWAYWEAYGLQLPPALRGLLDGVLHPIPDTRFSMEQVFAWMGSHPDMFY